MLNVELQPLVFSFVFPIPFGLCPKDKGMENWIQGIPLKEKPSMSPRKSFPFAHCFSKEKLSCASWGSANCHVILLFQQCHTMSEWTINLMLIVLLLVTSSAHPRVHHLFQQLFQSVRCCRWLRCISVSPVVLNVWKADCRQDSWDSRHWAETDSHWP